MRITFVLQHAYRSGGDRVVAIYAAELMRRGHQVTVISTPWPAPSLKDRVRQWLRPWAVRRPIGVVASHFDGTGIPHHVTEKSRAIVDADVPDGDVVIATWWETAEWVSRLSPSKGRKAYLIQHYETWGGDKDRVDATWRLPLKKIVISKWLADLARDQFGDREVAHVPNAVDTVQFDAPPRGKQATPTIGLLYSHVKFKGCDVAFAAIERVRGELPEARLIAMGLRPPAAELPLPANTTYKQDPPQEKIREIYAQCDVWLCASRSEGFHLPPLEAMACRCPVASTRVGGPLDIVEEGVNGFLVDVGDEAALADRVLRVLRLPQSDWRKMSDAAYATARGYTWSDACTRLEDVLRGFLPPPRRTELETRKRGD